MYIVFGLVQYAGRERFVGTDCIDNTFMCSRRYNYVNNSRWESNIGCH